MPWLRLLRIANLPSAISNILMSYLLVHQAWSPSIELGLLVLASCSMYLGGMVLNDYFDFEVDLEQRPNRPLPANQISKATAGRVGIALLCLGIVLAGIVGWMGSSHPNPIGQFSPLIRTPLIAVLLAVLIVLYDGPMKRTLAAPFLMGGCRSLNILLGASTFVRPGVDVETGSSGWFFLGLPIISWWVALAIGGLISGATLLGRKEAVETQSRTPLVVAGVMILTSLVAVALVVYCPQPHQPISQRLQTVFPIVVALISMTIVRRVVAAVFTAKPKQIQQGVVSVLRSLIIIDASLCYLAMPGTAIFALLVVALMIPTMLLGRWVPST